MGLKLGENGDYLEITNIDFKHKVIEFEIYKDEATKNKGLSQFDKTITKIIKFDDTDFKAKFNMDAESKKSVWKNVIDNAYDLIVTVPEYSNWTNDKKTDGL